MATIKQHKVQLKKLQKQVKTAQKKEEQNRNQLRAVLKKMRKLARTYKSKLASKMGMMQAKIAAAQSSTYAKVAEDLERQLLKGIEAKRKAIAAALAKIEKKHAIKIKKSMVKKGKKAEKVKKAKKTPVSAKPAGRPARKVYSRKRK